MANGSQYLAASPLSGDPFVLTCIFVIAKPRAAGHVSMKPRLEAFRPGRGGCGSNIFQLEWIFAIVMDC